MQTTISRGTHLSINGLTIPTTLLEIFFKIILNFKVIAKRLVDEDDNF